MSIRALIVDDEPLARERIRQLLEDEPDVAIIGECTDGLDAVDTISEETPDLVFLDVHMPGLDGFEVIEGLNGGPKPAVVFVTAHDSYAVQAFETHAADYLLKPVERERFRISLARVREDLQQDGHDPDLRLQALLASRRAQRAIPKRLAVRTDGRIVFVRTGDIQWIEAAGNYVRLYTAGERHLMRATISSVEGRLDPNTFLRVHRSAIVNLDYVVEIQPWFHGEYVVIMESGARVNLSRSYRQRVQAMVDALS